MKAAVCVLVSVLVVGGGVMAYLAIAEPGLDRAVLEKVLPEDTIFYLTIPNSPKVGEQYKKSSLHRLVNHKEVQAFIDPLMKLYQDAKLRGVQGQPPLNNMAEQMLGMSLDEFFGLFEGPVSLGVFDVFEQDGRPKSEPGIAAAIGAEDMQKLVDALSTIRETLKRQNPNLTDGEYTHKGYAIYTFGDAGSAVHYTMLANSIVLTGSRAHMAGMLDRYDSGAGTLEKSETYKAVCRRIKAGEMSLYSVYVNVEPLVSNVPMGEGAERQIVADLGLLDIRAMGMSMSYDLPQLRERYAVMTKRQDRGFVKLLMKEAGADPLVAAVPKEATGYMRFHLSLAEVYDTAMGIWENTDKQGYLNARKEMANGEKELGFEIRKDLLGSLGSAWSLYSMPPGKGMMDMNSIFMVELADPAKFSGILDKVLAKAGQELKVQSETHAGTKVSWVPIPIEEMKREMPPGLDLPFPDDMAVAWAVHGKTLCVALSPAYLRQHIDRAAKKGPSIEQNAEYADAKARVGDGGMISFGDYGRAITTVEPVRQLLSMFAEEMKHPDTGEKLVHPEKLPSAAALQETLGISYTAMRREGEFLMVETLSDLGVMNASIAGVGIIAAIAVPSLMQSKESAQNTVCMARMRTLMTASFMYRMDKGSFPDKTGSAFWAELSAADPPLVAPNSLKCPFAQGVDAKCTYWGPKSDADKLGGEDPFAMCDHPGHRGQVILLRMSGDVVSVPRFGPEHQEAMKKLKAPE